MKKFIPTAALFLIVIFFFWDLTKTFYQQDEWHGLGDVLSLGSQAIFIAASPLQIILGQGRILSDSLIFLFFYYAPLNIFPIALFIIFIHFVNSFLVYQLAYKFIRSRLFSFLGALFFIFNAVSSGAVIWPASGIGTLPATTLILLSIFTFLKFLEKRKIKWSILTFLLVYTSLYFKEIGIFLFLFYPLSDLLIYKCSFRNFLKTYTPFVLFFLASTFLMLGQLRGLNVQKDLFLTGASSNFGLTIVIRTILYPLTSFSLLYIPPNISFDIAKHITWIYYPFFPPSLYDLVAQTAVLDTLAIALSLSLFFLIFVLFKNENKDDKKKILFLVSLLLASFLPYIIVGKSFAYLESRYFYLAVSPASILFALIIKKVSNLKFLCRENLIIIVSLFLIMHVVATRNEMIRQKQIATERTSLLSQVMKTFPRFGSETVIYFNGDRNFYVTEGNPTPMQQGMGYTLLVWYYTKGQFSKELLPLIGDHFLWGIGEEGYRKVGHSGFGYFWNVKEMSTVIKKEKINKANIVGFYYDSKNKKVENITEDVRSQLE